MTYTVKRTDTVTKRTKTLASGIGATSVVDRRTSSNPFVYTVTARLPNGQTAELASANTLDISAGRMAIADTYIRDANRGERNGSATSAILKDGKSGDYVTREGVVRFDLSNLPFEDFDAELSVTFTGEGGSFSGNERLCFRTIADSDWTDASALCWIDTVGSEQLGGTAPDAVGVFATVDVNPSESRTVTVDASSAVRQALASGKTALTVHYYLDDPEHAANISTYTRENVMNCFAPQLTFRKRPWQEDSFAITIR